jgi:hypothetical protein
MAYASAGREAVLGAEAHRYERHRPEQTLLHRLAKQYYPAFLAAVAAEGREVPGTSRGSLRSTCAAGGWDGASCGFASRSATRSV